MIPTKHKQPVAIKHNLLNLLCICLLSITYSCKEKEEKPKNEEVTERPNIVFIMSDDHAYQAISAYDNSLIETPNIDRIAKLGMLFTNASVTNSICAPSRATILTGKHSHINGKIDNVSPFDTTNVTFPQLLQEAGYQTAMFGKLHFGNNPKGFNQFKILPGQGSYYNPDFIINGVKERINGYVTSITTELAINWLKNKRKKDSPFLLLYHQKAPHRNWKPEKKYFNLFDDKTFSLPQNFFDNYENRGTAAKTQEMLIAASEEQINSAHGNGGHARSLKTVSK